MTSGSAAREGWRLFARYAYAPNARGYCGPPQAAALEAVARGAGAGAGADVDVPGLARRFSGAWPYHVLIAELAGIDDPLDERVVRAYWTGSELTAEVDARRLGELLVERFAAQAAHYWAYLNEELLDEVTPTHVFHVLAVYPWSRLLGSGRPEPLEVLDSCRITSAEVLDVRGDRLLVRACALQWDGRQLRLGEPDDRLVGYWPAENPVEDPVAGDLVALHWGHACDRLSAQEHGELERWTDAQMRLTNRRLSRG